MRLRIFVCLAFVVAWTTALLTPQPVILAQVVLPPAAVFPAAKCLHVAAYATMAILMGWLRLPFRFRVLALVFMSSHAMGTEFFQQFVPGRHASWADVGLDHLGVALGIGLHWGWCNARRRPPDKKGGPFSSSPATPTNIRVRLPDQPNLVTR